MSRVGWIWLVLVCFAVGTSMVTPLIPIYQQQLGFNDTVVTLFLGSYVVTLVPSMLGLGQLSDRVGRRVVLIAAIVTLAIAQLMLLSTPPLWGLMLARTFQGAASGAFFGTCTAFLVDSAAPIHRARTATLGSISIRLGLGLGPGLAGVLAQYASHPLQTPFALHLVLLGIACTVVIVLPETVDTAQPARPMRLRLDVPPAERAIFWRILVPSGMLFSLFDATALSLLPVFIVRTLDIRNYAVAGAAGCLVLVSGALSQLWFRHLHPAPAITRGLAVASLASFGIVAAQPLESAPLVLLAITLTGGACGLVFKGGMDLITQIAPLADRGKLISAYMVACYVGGFSIPLMVLGLLSDLLGLVWALVILSVSAGLGAIWTARVGMRALPGGMVRSRVGLQ